MGTNAKRNETLDGRGCTKWPEDVWVSEGEVEGRKRTVVSNWRLEVHDLPFTSILRLTEMTKYAIHPKSSSGLVFFYFLVAHIRFTSDIKIRTAPYRSPKFHVTRGAQAVLKPRQRLNATREALDESEELAFYRRLHSYRDRDDPNHRHQNGVEEDESGDWADESTLIAMFQEKYVSTWILRVPVLARRVTSLSDPLEDEDCDVAGLLDRLNDAMVAYRPGLRDYLKNALIPTVHHQTRLHSALREHIDTSFATGVLSIDQVCKNVESFRLKDEDDITGFYSGTKVRTHSASDFLYSSLPSRQRWDSYRRR